LLEETVRANNQDIVLWTGEGGIDPFADMRNYFPFDNNSWLATQWGLWNSSGGTAGERPTDPQVLRQFELWSRILVTPDPSVQAGLMRELLNLSADIFWAIGISTLPPGYKIVSNRLGNVPNTMFAGWDFVEPASVNPTNFYFIR